MECRFSCAVPQGSTADIVYSSLPFVAKIVCSLLCVVHHAGRFAVSRSPQIGAGVVVVGRRVRVDVAVGVDVHHSRRRGRPPRPNVHRCSYQAAHC